MYDMEKALAIASDFVQGNATLFCPDCGTALVLNQKDPWFNGVCCPHCSKTYPWQYWARYQEKWSWDETGTGLIRVHGDDTEPEIPYRCNRIRSYAFSNSIVSTLRIPDSVKVIEPFAFANAGHLRHVELPMGLQRIEEGTFSGCGQLTSVVIPRTVRYIGKNAFAGCTALRRVRLPETLGVIDRGAFRGAGLTDLRLRRVSLIGESAFENCNALHTADLGALQIGKRSFAGCSALRTVKLYNGLYTIDESAFQGCIGLRELWVPETVFEFGKYAFADIPGLVVQLPACLEDHVANFDAFQLNVRNEKLYIFDETARLHYYEGSEH